MSGTETTPTEAVREVFKRRWPHTHVPESLICELASAAVNTCPTSQPKAVEEPGGDERELGELALRLIDVVHAHIASGATPLRTAMCKILRPHLRSAMTEAEREKVVEALTRARSYIAGFSPSALGEVCKELIARLKRDKSGYQLPSELQHYALRFPHSVHLDAIDEALAVIERAGS